MAIFMEEEEEEEEDGTVDLPSRRRPVPVTLVQGLT